jgi:DNA-binding XRE family transcriptional regulator
MPKQQMFSESDLTALAKKWRIKSGKRKAKIAEELGAARPSIQLAEENPEQSLTKLRVRIIEACSPYRVRGPGFWLERKE